MSAQIHVRRALLSEAASLASLHRVCFETPWNAESFNTLLSDEHILALVTSNEEGEIPAALIVVRSVAEEAEILTLGTHPSSRRLGHARALVTAGAAEAVARGASELFLEVSEANLAARGLYAGLGFSPVGRRSAYYQARQGPADALVFRAGLPLCE